MIRWLTREIILAMHRELIAEHGGLPGLRDGNLLESALGRPRNLFAHERPDIFRLGASYAYGIARNHPFFDGNKRTAAMSAFVFLGLNKMDLHPPEESMASAMLDLARGELEEDALAIWLTENSSPIGPGNES